MARSKFFGTRKTPFIARPIKCRSIPARARSPSAARSIISVNAPLAKGDGGAAFRAAFNERILSRLNAFGPDIIIVCAGFDARLHDPLGGLRLVESDFAEVTLRIMEIAARRCRGRVVSLLEGGYRPENLATCVAAHVGALMSA
jgi:acetoin utilization deacetylase AcuC-like enzyme